MSYQIDVQYALEPEPEPKGVVNGVPNEEKLIEWASAALCDHVNDAEMTIRIVDEAEISELNQTYRNKSGTTNVLSFPADIPEEIELPLLGDVIICAAVVVKEAQTQHKAADAHWAHMVVHGCLHLLGYDHISDVEAGEMESKEIEILAKFGYPNPYMVIKEI